jgi:hypothetical protein
MSNIKLTKTSHPNFCDEKGRAFLVTCPECLSENYSINVAAGICTWCGYDLNETKIIEEEIN